MARGTESKVVITQKLLEVFPNAFTYDKEIRIPIEENGEIVQIKCVLTCAKTNVNAGSDNAMPTMKSVSPSGTESAFDNDKKPAITEISAEEKRNVENLIESLGL